jgi:tetratricopeptide (TPR) repeat protein
MKDQASSRFANSGLAVASTCISVAALVAVELSLRWLAPAPSNLPAENALRQASLYFEPCSALARLDRGSALPRIAVVGESSGDFVGQVLERMAQNGAAAQVANCAQPGAPFSVFVRRFEEILGAAPDAIIVVFGHNYDFEEPMTRWQIRLARVRLHSRLMNELAERLGLTSSPPLRAARDLGDFESFLHRAARESRERGVRLVLSTMTSNHLYPPIQDAVASPDLYAARFLRMRDPLAGARRLADLVAASDDAGAAFELGVWRESDGDETAARAAFERALVLDRMRFRAPQAQADMIRRVAREESVLLHDGEALRAARAPDGIAGWETVMDNCHLHSDLFEEEAAALLALLGVSGASAPSAYAPLDRFDAVLAYLSNWLDMAMRGESEWLAVAPLWRFLRIGAPRLEERADAWIEDCAARRGPDPSAAGRARSLLLAASAEAHWLAGQRERARVLNQRARTASDAARPWVWKGLYDVADERFEEARLSFAKALEIEPQRQDARSYLEQLREVTASAPAEGSRAGAGSG